MGLHSNEIEGGGEWGEVCLTFLVYLNACIFSGIHLGRGTQANKFPVIGGESRRGGGGGFHPGSRGFLREGCGG